MMSIRAAVAVTRIQVVLAKICSNDRRTASHPTRMSQPGWTQADPVLVGPDLFHRLEVEALEGVVEAVVEASDRLPVVRLAMRHPLILSG